MTRIDIRTSGDLLHQYHRLRAAARQLLGEIRPGVRIFHGDRPRGVAAILPGSFDPPTEAHIAIVRSLLNRPSIRHVLVVLDTENADKASHHAPLLDRIALTTLAFRKTSGVSVAVSTEGRFLEKIAALKKAGLVKGKPLFAVGADTVARLTQERFYGRPESDIPRLCRSARFLAFPREDGPPPDSRLSVETLPLSARLQSISSTSVRRALREGSLPLREAPLETLFCIREEALYQSARRARAEVVTSFLTRGGRVLILKRSARVGSFRGSWAGVSGYLDWPLARLPDLLMGKVTAAQMRRQTLRQAYKEIREETGIARKDLFLLRRHAPLRHGARTGRRDWIVHPFLFRLKDDTPVHLDWEHVEGRWIWGEEIRGYPTVPGLDRTLRSVCPPRSRRRSAPGAPDRAGDIAKDPKSGAMEILSGALDLLREIGQFGPEGEDAFRSEVDLVCAGLLSGHPMAPLQNLVDRVRAEGRDKRGLLQCVSDIEGIVEKGDREVLRKAKKALRGSRTVATFSYSSTVLSVITSLSEKSPPDVFVVADDEGHSRRFAQKMRRAGVRAARLVPSLPEETDILILGSDAIYGKGWFLNAAGTRSLVEMARRRKVPVLVLGHPLKVRPRRPRRISDPALEMIPLRSSVTAT